MKEGKKYFRVAMIVEANVLHEVLSAVDGKAYEVSTVAVKVERSSPTAAQKLTGRQLIEQEIERASKTTERQITVAELRAKGIALGVPLSSIYSTLHTMKKDKQLLQTSVGVYQLPALAIENKSAKVSKVTAPMKPPAKGTNRAAILALFRTPQTILSRAEIIEKLSAKGIESADGPIYQLAQKGFLTKLSDGKFQLNH